MQKVEFLTIFPTYGNLAVVQKTLPSVIKETQKYKEAKLIVHDSTEIVHGQQEKWDYLRKMEQEFGFFLILSTNLSMAHARNMCLQLGQELFAPDYICMLEDDHGYQPNLINSLVEGMKRYYGKEAPNGFKYGMFSACVKHTNADIKPLDDFYSYPSVHSSPFTIGGFNSCFRCAPANHWYSVLKGYDTDEYLISNFQTANLRWRNYHKGFTVLFLGNGQLIHIEESEGRGETDSSEIKLWDKEFAASDKRSIHIKKAEGDIQQAIELRSHNAKEESNLKKQFKTVKNLVRSFRKK